ncbi:transcriptional regulator [Cupriavidus basilensis OR16]|uniref:Transcriptional regulator n=1 Tax=Cupriavidus basilensis OR16 TaxID=1127483 RepID=H1RZG2_9BURK|nr:AraC family transcriptional regulator [Cupriavidus basilensis]EHP44304.1 transcriptional regulator [Cupriavidus basilensis OR16]
MTKDRLIRIARGRYGRATLHLIDGALVSHAHAEFHLIFKLGGADASFVADGQTVRVLDGSALAFNPWVSHSKLDSGGDPSLLLALLLEPEWLGNATGVTNPASGCHFCSASVPVSEKTATDLQWLATLMAQQGTEDGADGIEAVLASLVQGVAQNHLRQRNMTEILANSRPLDFRVRRAADYIRQHAAENPNVEHVAAAVGISRSRLFDQFKACMGVSPQQYLDWVRVRQATRLLAQPGVSVGDVSHQLGFSAQSHFTRFFVQHLGLSPTEFRRNGALA